LQPPGIFKLVIFAFGIMACAFLPSYVCAVYWKKANKVGSIASMIAGATTNVIWTACGLAESTALDPFFIGVIVSTVFMIVFSHFGKPTSKGMMDNMDRAKGKRIEPAPARKAARGFAVSEARAISDHVSSHIYVQAKGLVTA
jgi:sodium/proline symporter